MQLAAVHARYLRLLGFTSPPVGPDGLSALVREHLFRVPFENISKLLLREHESAGRVTTLPEFLGGIEHHDLGGTCYTNNPYLYELLRAIGYDADLLAADMTNPDVHTSIRVRLDSAEYHIDVGFGAPFSQPIALGRLPHVIRCGVFRYALDRDVAPGRYEMAVWRGDERVHRYVVHGPPREFEYFRRTIEESYLPGKTFMTWLRIARFFDDHAVDLIDRKLTIHRGCESREIQLNSMQEMRAAVDNELRMPRCPVGEAIGVLERLNGKRFFD
jgi:arylamine N-acetyltransferase